MLRASFSEVQVVWFMATVLVLSDTFFVCVCLVSFNWLRTPSTLYVVVYELTHMPCARVHIAPFVQLDWYRTAFVFILPAGIRHNWCLSYTSIFDFFLSPAQRKHPLEDATKMGMPGH